MCSKDANRYKLNSQHDGGNPYDHLMSTRIFTWIMNEIFIRDPKIMRQIVQTQFGIANHLAPVACFISYENIHIKHVYLSCTLESFKPTPNSVYL